MRDQSGKEYKNEKKNSIDISMHGSPVVMFSRMHRQYSEEEQEWKTESHGKFLYDV